MSEFNITGWLKNHYLAEAGEPSSKVTSLVPLMIDAINQVDENLSYKDLAEAIQNDFKDYVAEDGFFWGQQFQEESVKEYKEQDIKFLKFCEQAINEKKVVEYWCSW